MIQFLKLAIIEWVNLYQSVPVQPIIKSFRLFGLAQLKGQIIISERRFWIHSYQLRIFHKQSWVILTRSENEKMICSAELESYQKRTLPSLSVTNELPNKTEIQKMSNLRNLFCMVAILFTKVHQRDVNLAFIIVSKLTKLKLHLETQI